MTHRPCIISDADILNPPKLTIAGRCYRQIPISDHSFAPELHVRGRDTSQFHDVDEEEECDDDSGIVETSKGFSLEVHVPEPLHRFVVGRRGETKHKLENETRTQISIPKQGVAGPVVIKGHDRSTVLSAKTRIELLLEQSRWKHPFTHFLSFRLAEEEVVNGFKQFKVEVREECKGDRGIDDSIFQQPQKLHLTLGTLVVLDDREVTAASRLLHHCVDTFIGELVTEGPLNADIEELEYMNDDPYNVDILYAKIKLTDQTDRLQELADRVTTEFIKAGFMQQQYDRVKMHCTVMNSIFRSDATGMRLEPEKADENKKNAAETQDDERRPFDASQLLKKLGKFHFGNLTLRDLHISTRFTTDKDGYYRPAAKVSF